MWSGNLFRTPGQGIVKQFCCLGALRQDVKVSARFDFEQLVAKPKQMGSRVQTPVAGSRGQRPPSPYDLAIFKDQIQYFEAPIHFFRIFCYFSISLSGVHDFMGAALSWILKTWSRGCLTNPVMSI